MAKLKLGAIIADKPVKVTVELSAPRSAVRSLSTSGDRKLCIRLHLPV